MKTKVRRRTVISIAALGLVLAGCAKGSSPSSGGSAAGSAPGVTATTVTVGNVSVLGGPIPGLFAGAPDAVKAYFNYINSQGGVNGRKLEVTSLDDGYSCTQNESQTQTLVNSTFAMVGNFSVFDNCGESVVKKNPGWPDVSATIGDVDMISLPNVYSASPSQPGGIEGPLKYFRQKYPNDTKMGTMITDNPGAINTWQQNLLPVAQAVGYQLVYSRTFQATEIDFTPDVIRMKAAGVQVLYTPSMDPQAYGRLLQAAQQQNWHPDIEYNGSAYAASFGKLAPGTSGNGTLYAGNTAPFLEGANSSYASVKLLTEWMKKTNPGVPVDNYAASGWANAALFVQALKEAGANPTQQGLLKALSTIHNFTAGGFQAPTDAGAKQPSECYLVFQYAASSGTWSIYGQPGANGFQCAPGGYLHAKS